VIAKHGPVTVSLICADADNDDDPNITLRVNTAVDNTVVGILTTQLDGDLDANENADDAQPEVSGPGTTPWYPLTAIAGGRMITIAATIGYKGGLGSAVNGCAGGSVATG
jgi:hypothetical protein